MRDGSQVERLAAVGFSRQAAAALEAQIEARIVEPLNQCLSRGRSSVGREHASEAPAHYRRLAGIAKRVGQELSFARGDRTQRAKSGRGERIVGEQPDRVRNQRAGQRFEQRSAHARRIGRAQIALPREHRVLGARDLGACGASGSSEAKRSPWSDSSVVFVVLSSHSAPSSSTARSTRLRSSANT